MNNLPADILNCEVCRQRLGLPPLSRLPSPVVPSIQVTPPKSTTPATPLSSANNTLLPAPKSAPGRALGSPEQIHRQAKGQAAEHAKMQAEWKKQLEEAEAANRKTQTMLENRSAEVGELKLQLKSQLEANAKLEANLKDAKDNKPESKKLKRSKGKRKKPAKPS